MAKNWGGTTSLCSWKWRGCVVVVITVVLVVVFAALLLFMLLHRRWSEFFLIHVLRVLLKLYVGQ
jgi:hypothetical protein